MKVIFILASLLIAVTISAFPTINTTHPDSTQASERRTIDRRVGPERVTCYNSGKTIDRRDAISGINSFCAEYRGQTFASGRRAAGSYTFPPQPILALNLIIIMEAVNGCTVTVDDNCGRVLRAPIDQCNTRGEDGKQGGTLTDNCAIWRIDPN